MRSHVLCVASQNGKYFVVRDGRYYVFPDSVLHGKLDWNRSDAKRLAVKLLEHATHGVVTGEAQEIEKVFGMKETHRAVSVTADLDTLFPILQRVQKYWKKELDAQLESLDARLVTLADIDVLSIEGAHILRHFENVRLSAGLS